MSTPFPHSFDAIILGAGAAGLMCACDAEAFVELNRHAETTADFQGLLLGLQQNQPVRAAERVLLDA